MNGQDGRSGRRRRTRAASGGSRRDPLGRLSITRLLLTCGALALAAVMTQRMLSPLVVGWRRAEALLEAEDRLLALDERAKWLQDEIAYKRTDNGRMLEAFEQQGVVRRGGHTVRTVPKSVSSTAGSPQTLAQQAQALREQGWAYLYSRWRVVALCVLDKRLPPSTRP